MNCDYAVPPRLRAQTGKILLFTFVLINLCGVYANAQTIFSRDQFSRLSVLSRASFFENEIIRAADREGVDPNILWAIAYNETRFRPWLTSPKNARGLMQFIPATAVRFDLSDPYDPVASIRAAARYVRYLSTLFGGRIDSVLAAYNSGEGTVSAFLSGRTMRIGQKTINPQRIKTIGGVPPYQETSAYVANGLKIYRWLISKGTFPTKYFRGGFPDVVSISVGRLFSFKPENLRIAELRKEKRLPGFQKAADLNKTITQNTVPPIQQNPPVNNAAEVFYDSRSGKRFLVNQGNKTILSEGGAVIVTSNSRPITSHQARSIYFAARER